MDGILGHDSASSEVRAFNSLWLCHAQSTQSSILWVSSTWDPGLLSESGVPMSLALWAIWSAYT